MSMTKELEYAIEEITEVAKGFGLDFYPMRYEICPPDIIYTFGAYGMPTRFSHWSFGKQFHRMKLQYDLGLSQIYELVINSDPCYAFLLNTNTLIQNKLIIAHVLAHCDFFKNNVRFSNTRRDMVESMTATAERIAEYEMIYGKDEVEKFLDAVLSIQEHIDPSLMRSKLNYDDVEDEEEEVTKPQTPYDDLWGLDEKPKEKKTRSKKGKNSRPVRRRIYCFLLRSTAGSWRTGSGYAYDDAGGNALFLAAAGDENYERRVGILLASADYAGTGFDDGGND